MEIKALDLPGWLLSEAHDVVSSRLYTNWTCQIPKNFASHWGYSMLRCQQVFAQTDQLSWWCNAASTWIEPSSHPAFLFGTLMEKNVLVFELAEFWKTIFHSNADSTLPLSRDHQFCVLPRPLDRVCVNTRVVRIHELNAVIYGQMRVSIFSEALICLPRVRNHDWAWHENVTHL